MSKAGPPLAINAEHDAGDHSLPGSPVPTIRETDPSPNIIFQEPGLRMRAGFSRLRDVCCRDAVIL